MYKYDMSKFCINDQQFFQLMLHGHEKDAKTIEWYGKLVMGM